MDDLVQFLHDRFDEDKKAALDAGGDRWSHHGGSLMWPTERGPRDAVVAHQGSAVGCVAITNPIHGDGGPEALHITRHDPARVLAEVEAKQRIVQALKSAEVSLRNTEPGKEPHELMTGAANSLRAAVRMLAAVYAEHPDYRQEWRP